jgi:folate-binding protein YgfZ
MNRGADVAAEYQAVRHAAGVAERGLPGVLEVTGKDRAAFLHAMLSNDVKGLGPGQGCRASFLDVHGKVQALLVVLALEDRLLVLTPPGDAPRVLEALDRYLFSEKAYFEDRSGETAALLVAGPETPAVLARLGVGAVPEAAWAHAAAEIAGVAGRVVVGGGETGEREAWLLVPAAEAARVREAAAAAGARAVGDAALEALRIEAGWPVYGREADDGVLLPELPLLPLVSYTKGCYIGQEVVVRVRDRGHVNRLLRGLVLDGDVVPERGDAVVAGGRDVGRVTSAAWSPGLERPVALAIVRREHEPGAEVAVRRGDREVPARVSALPIAR